jgi:hypothetical protein
MTVAAVLVEQRQRNLDQTDPYACPIQGTAVTGLGSVWLVFVLIPPPVRRENICGQALDEGQITQ